MSTHSAHACSVCAYVCVCPCMCVLGRQRTISGVNTQALSTIWTASFIGSELAKSAGLAGQRSPDPPGMHLYSLLNIGTVSMCYQPWHLYVSAGDRTEILMLVKLTCYRAISPAYFSLPFIFFSFLPTAMLAPHTTGYWGLNLEFVFARQWLFNRGFQSKASLISDSLIFTVLHY